MPLETDSRYRLSEALRPAVEDALTRLWPGSRMAWLPVLRPGVPDPLDQAFGIDGELTTPHGICLTVQSKVREHRWLERHEYTLEVFNDDRRTQPGEWFNLTADLYFYGYATPERTALADWYLFKIVDLKLAIEAGEVHFGGLIPNEAHSRALFTTMPWEALPGVALVATCPEPLRAPWGAPGRRGL